MNSKKKAGDGGTHVNIVLGPGPNQILEHSAQVNGRSKRREAGKRLAHHLQLYGDNWQTEIDTPEN